MGSVLKKISSLDRWIVAEDKVVESEAGLSNVLKNSRIFKNCIFENLEIKNVHLHGIVFASCSFRNIKLYSSSFNLTSFFGSTFEDCTLEDVELISGGFNHTIMRNITFEECGLNNSRFIEMKADKLVFRDCNIAHAIFLKNEFDSEHVTFKLCNEEEAYFVDR